MTTATPAAEQQARTITVLVEGLSSKYINADRARELTTMSEDNFRNALSVIRQMCDDQIKKAAGAQKTYTTFAVPASLFGYDAYDHEKMGKCLALSLYNDGFSVRGPPRLLQVIWGREYSGPLTRKMLAKHDAMMAFKKKVQ